MLKDKDFIDWFAEHISHGYGTGEQYTIPCLKLFLENCPEDGNYDFEVIQNVVGKAETWFLMSIFGKTDVINYGTSPRYGWLDDKGKLLKQYVDGKTVDALYGLVMTDGDYVHCGPTYCNCGPNGYEKDRKCPNPLFK